MGQGQVRIRVFFFFQAEDGIRDIGVTGVQTCALPIFDMMSHYYDAELPALVKAGRVSMAVVDEAVRRVLRVKFALGLFDHPFADGAEEIGRASCRERV